MCCSPWHPATVSKISTQRFIFLWSTSPASFLSPLHECLLNFQGDRKIWVCDVNHATNWNFLAYFLQRWKLSCHSSAHRVKVTKGLLFPLSSEHHMAHLPHSTDLRIRWAAWARAAMSSVSLLTIKWLSHEKSHSSWALQRPTCSR